MKVVLVWLALCLVWGTTWIFIKVGLDDLPPVSFAASRFAVAVLVLLPFLLWKKIEFPKTRSQIAFVTITGVLQFFVNYGLLFWGEQHISSGLAAVLQATIPVFGLVLARVYVPSETINWWKIVSLVLGLAGVAVIFKEQLQIGGWLSFLGSAAVVVGAFAAAYASVLVKAKAQGMHPASLVWGQMLVGLLPLALVGYLKEGNPIELGWTKSAVICVIYLAVPGSIVAFGLYYWLLKRIDVTRAMMISFVTPLIAVVIGALYRGENLRMQTLLGGILILSSVGIVVGMPLLKHRYQPVSTEAV